MTRSYKQLEFSSVSGFTSSEEAVVSREVKRNSGGRGYRFAQAQRKAAGPPRRPPCPAR